MKSLSLFPALVLASCIYSNHLQAQAITWSTPAEDETVVVNGISERQAPAAAVFSGRMYMAYTSTTVGTAPGNPHVQYKVFYGSNPGGYTTYVPVKYINPSGGAAWTSLNPSLLAFNSNLYLTMADNFGSGGPQSQPSYVSMNAAGVWGVVTGFPVTAAPSGSSVGMATDGIYLYLGYRNINDNTLVICRMNTSQVITCTNFPGTTQMGFSPGRAFSGGKLYIAFQNNSSHNLDYYVSSDQGLTIGSLITTAATDQTSTAPSLALHGGYLYMGFRTNDGAHGFAYKATSNGGTSWSSRSAGGYSMGGNPVLVDGGGLSQAPTYFYNIFAHDETTHYLSTSIAP